MLDDLLLQPTVVEHPGSPAAPNEQVLDNIHTENNSRTVEPNASKIVEHTSKKPKIKENEGSAHTVEMEAECSSPKSDRQMTNTKATAV